ncbi:ScyD/ScyE family protein [Actinomycetes bacterium KLBMP 9797]
MSLSRIVSVGVLAAAVVMAGAPAASAAESVAVIAKKLDNPRGIALGPKGSLLVAEAGKGGKGPCIPSPEDPAAQVCLGRSSALTVLTRDDDDWEKKRIVTGLPSVANKDGSFALGLHDITLMDGKVLGTIGLGGSPEVRKKLGKDGRLLGHLVTLRPSVRSIVDLAEYEAKNNPDGKEPGSAVDSNPYGILAKGDQVYVTDAGGNTLLAVTKKKNVSTVAVFRPRMVRPPSNIPNLPPRIPMQGVPTAVAKGPDGALYVGELTGFPFLKNGARVWKLEKGKRPAVSHGGFTNIIDVTFDRKGRMLVLLISKNGLASGPGSTVGALIRVEKSGIWKELAAGKLTMPGGVAVARDGTIYVTNKSVTPGGGEVLRIRE